MGDLDFRTLLSLGSQGADKNQRNSMNSITEKNKIKPLYSMYSALRYDVTKRLWLLLKIDSVHV